MPTRKRILVHQVKEWGEILLGFECRNRWEIRDEQDQLLGYAAEEGGGLGRMLGRQLFSSGRKAVLHVTDAQGQELARGDKPFTWFFHRLDVYAGDRKLGAIERRFRWLSREFQVTTADGQELFTIESSLFGIWTFRLMFRGTEVGVIKKQWGGALKEMFTDADRFGIEYDDLPELAAVRPLLIFATMLVDLVHFENNTGGGSLFDFS